MIQPIKPVGKIPILGQNNTPQQAALAAINQAVQQLSLGIYSRLAGDYIASRDTHQPAEREHLQQLARDSQVAAQAFFEGLGVAQFSTPEDKDKERPSL